MKYKMSAEWEPHEGTWLAWPHNESHWPGKFEVIPGVFAQIARELSKAGEKVFICVQDAKMESHARELIGKNVDNIYFYHIPTDASWARDHGPIFVKDEHEKRIITDWVFNMWGGKYPPWENDDVVPQKIGEIFKIPVIQPGIVLEGGSINVNGKGSLLTTEQCLLNKNRNPNLNRNQIEKYLGDFLGATNVLWLKEGIIGDDTDGHVDDIAAFSDPQTIVCAVEENSGDENYEILQRNYEDLQKMRDQDGKPFYIVKMPMPDPLVHDGQRLPASYINFYIANKAVLLPTFRANQDAEAVSILAKLFPRRKIVEIDCWDLIWGLGSIHCSTQQQPA
ncbi:MAG: agmatine deiminase family protein [Patescibacteria group bacterium]